MAHVSRVPAAKSPRDARVTPSSRTLDLPADHREGFDPEAFETFAERLRKTLAPASVMEELLADRVVLAAWRLQERSQAEVLAMVGLEPSASASLRRQARRAERDFESAFKLLTLTRDQRACRWGTRESIASARPAASPCEPSSVCDGPELSNEWTPLRERRREVEPSSDEPEGTEEPAGWEDRLTVDPNVSQVSPVVRGTWVTAEQVVSLIVDGWTWSDVLRTHPELTEDDIRACLSYTVDQDEFGDL
ncbi:MAG: DUF433 domain-containing protein [Isosphaeraceae bacterium]